MDGDGEKTARRHPNEDANNKDTLRIPAFPGVWKRYFPFYTSEMYQYSLGYVSIS
jgi:hypothetical protein